MNVVFPPTDTVSFEDGNAVFDALVDGASVRCIVTERALGAASPADQVLSKQEAFSLGEAKIKETVMRLLCFTTSVPVVVTSADLSHSF
ncbi:DUF1488 family protein [Caballeronia sordidicola]|uniref:DUF1488 family protein n=1 Tax=Caballeronia sordidicola TaxID=196367 RepID=UPI00068BE609|nr:DUF1488 family protein [Caballeronia sordidicola]